MVYNNILEAIGHTPMIRLNRINKPGSAEILVKFEGLYDRKGESFEAKCHNFDTESPYTNMYKEPRKYVPKKGANVYVTIDKNGGEITSMVNMDKDFEQKLQKTPDKIKYDCNGAYFEEK